MRKNNRLAFVVLICLASLLSSARSLLAVDIGFVVVGVGELPGNIIEFVRGKLEDNISCSVRIGVTTNDGSGDPSLLVADFVRMKGSNDLGVIAIVYLPGEIAFREYYSVEKKIAVLNIAPLQPNNSHLGVGIDLWSWRIVKQTTGLCVRLMELDPCPFPLCGVFPCMTLKELDVKARGPCPPCLMRIDRWMMQKGIVQSSGIIAEEPR